MYAARELAMERMETEADGRRDGINRCGSDSRVTDGKDTRQSFRYRDSDTCPRDDHTSPPPHSPSRSQEHPNSKTGEKHHRHNTMRKNLRVLPAQHRHLPRITICHHNINFFERQRILCNLTRCGLFPDTPGFRCPRSSRVQTQKQVAGDTAVSASFPPQFQSQFDGYGDSHGYNTRPEDGFMYAGHILTF